MGDQILMPLGDVGMALGVRVDSRSIGVYCTGIGVGCAVRVRKDDIYVWHFEKLLSLDLFERTVTLTGADAHGYDGTPHYAPRFECATPV
jgi:hypothetical protein